MRGMRVLRRLVIYFSTLILVAGYSFSGMAGAQEATTTSATPTTTETQPASNTLAAPSTDTSSASTSTSSSTPTSSTTPKITYTYNPLTGHWDSTEWVYDPTTGTYVKPPTPTIITPTTTSTAPTDTTAQPTADQTANQTTNTNTNTQVGNTVGSQATSGDATVSSNGTAGSATTGDAVATATIVNMVNSVIGADGSDAKIASFTKDIYGDVQGDIILSPLLLKAMLEAKAPAGTTDTTINANNTTGITNNVTVGAQSGGAAVTQNTSAGDATSGSATAVANVVNILNSLIATQQSFIGTINIYGNLQGNILIAPDFIPQLVASNNDTTTSGSTEVSSQDTQTIVNNISAVADSGAASVFGNTSAGNATTGSAQTNVVIFNLSGHQVVAKDSLLVFVNVLGKWVGVIVDAPQGATAAMLSTGVTSNTYTPDLTVNAASAAGITNTIAVTAHSGNALVSGNTNAGNAVTGSTQALANISNITGSQFSAADWFGILFINVYQNWFGNFGLAPRSTTTGTESPAPSAPIEFHPASVVTTTRTPAHMRLIDSRSLSPVQDTTSPTHSVDTQDPAQDQAVLGAQQAQSTDAPYDFRFVIIIGSLVVIGLSAIGLKRLLG